MEELKPCPFCEGEALLIGDYAHGYFVECHDCSAKTANYGSENKAEAIAAWNSRAELGSEPPYDELVRCLKNDWNIRVSWDGLRKFWSIELTEEGVRLRDAESNSRAERICHETMIDKYFRGCDSCGWMWEVFYSFGKRERPNYCPNCGAKVVTDGQ